MFNYEKRVPGIYPDVNITDYHKTYIDIVSNSYLSRMADCPAKAKIPIKVTPAMIMGRAIHKYALEGAVAFDLEYAVMPEFKDRRPVPTSGWKNTTEYKTMVREFTSRHQGKEIISHDDFITVCEMSEAMRMNPVVRDLLDGGFKEVSVFWQDTETGIWNKSRPDGVPSFGHTVIDLKKVADGMCNEHSFQSTIVNRGYNRQGAMALHGLNEVSEAMGLGRPYDTFILIAVEDSPPYKTMHWVIDARFLNNGFAEYRRLMRIEKACREQNVWPNYEPSNLLNLRTLDPNNEMGLPGYLREEGRAWEKTPQEER